jgi:hypothetical protein
MFTNTRIRATCLANLFRLDLVTLLPFYIKSTYCVASLNMKYLPPAATPSSYLPVKVCYESNRMLR